MSTDKNQAQGVIAYLDTIKPMAIADDPAVKEKFIAIVDALHGSGEGIRMHTAERHYFMKHLLENQDLQQCTKFSLYGAFMDLAVNGLSLDPHRRLAYLMYNTHKVKYKDEQGNDRERYEKRAVMEISPYGELSLRIQYGQLLGADNPEVVYEGEEFRKFTSKDGTLVEHQVLYPRPKAKIIACYIRLVKGNGTVDYFVMDEIQMQRLKGYSAKKNNGKANALYGDDTKGPDLGFWIAKTVKHAFKAYPKIKLRGNFAALATDNLDDELDGMDYYEMTTDPPAAQKQEEPPVKQEEPAKQEPTAEEQPVKKQRDLGF